MSVVPSEAYAGTTQRLQSDDVGPNARVPDGLKALFCLMRRPSRLIGVVKVALSSDVETGMLYYALQLLLTVRSDGLSTEEREKDVRAAQLRFSGCLNSSRWGEGAARLWTGMRPLR